MEKSLSIRLAGLPIIILHHKEMSKTFKTIRAETISEDISPRRMEMVKAHHEELKKKSTDEVKKLHSQTLGKVHSNYTSAEVGGKRSMIADILRYHHGNAHVAAHFNLKEEAGAGEWGTPELTKKLKDETPGQGADEDTVEEGVANTPEEHDRLMNFHHEKAQKKLAAGDLAGYEKHLDMKYKHTTAKEKLNGTLPTKKFEQTTTNSPKLAESADAVVKPHRWQGTVNRKHHVEVEYAGSGKSAQKKTKKIVAFGSSPAHAVRRAHHLFKKAGLVVRSSRYIGLRESSNTNMISITEATIPAALHAEYLAATEKQHHARAIYGKNKSATTHATFISAVKARLSAVEKMAKLSTSDRWHNLAKELRDLSNKKFVVREETENVESAEEISLANAKEQIEDLANMADDLVDVMEDTDELEDWAQEKINTAYLSLAEVHDYVTSEDEDSDNDTDDSSLEDDEYAESDDESVTESTQKLSEEAESAEDISRQDLARLAALVRMGLVDTAKLPVIRRALANLAGDRNITDSGQRAAINDLVVNLMMTITGDNSVFARVKANLRA